MPAGYIPQRINRKGAEIMANAGAARGRQRKIKYYTQYDFMLLFMTIALALFGVLMIYSASSYVAMYKFNNPYRFVKQQLIGMGAGILCMLFVSNQDYQLFVLKLPGTKMRLAEVTYWIALFMQTIVLIPGIGIAHNGSRRWLGAGPLQFQPSEITKIAVILLVADIAYRNRKMFDNYKGLIGIAIYILLPTGLIAVQNLSTALTVAGIGFGMAFVASRKKWLFVILPAVAFVVVWLYIKIGGGYRMNRITAWRNVETSDKGFQILQGLYAIASGGLFGSGLGQSMQKLGYIPEAYNDMIFAVICEELGLVGAVVLMFAFLVLLWRIMIIACNAPDIFGSMICVGVMVHIAVQVILNIAVVTNTIPSTGVPLPFISYGGTASAIMMAEMGLVLGVSRQIKLK